MDSPHRPYRMEEQPSSPGRVFLARAFAHWCALHFGLSSEEVEAALVGEADEIARMEVDGACGPFGWALARDAMAAWARPIGGGLPTRLLPATWELDEFRTRIAASAICLERPFDRSAEATHWIFLDLDGFNDMIEASCADARSAGRAKRAAGARDAFIASDNDEAGPPVPARPPDRHLRLDEVMRLTGLSRSTIYARIGEKRFPPTVENNGRVAAWRESAVADWLASPT